MCWVRRSLLAIYGTAGLVLSVSLLGSGFVTMPQMAGAAVVVGALEISNRRQR